MQRRTLEHTNTEGKAENKEKNEPCEKVRCEQQKKQGSEGKAKGCVEPLTDR